MKVGVVVMERLVYQFLHKLKLWLNVRSIKGLPT